MLPNRNSILFCGRFDYSKDGSARFAWAGTSLTIRFIGKKVSALLESTGEDYFLVIVDGKILCPSLRIGKKKSVTLAHGLSDGPHTLTLYKKTECFIGTAAFYGFDLNGGEYLEPPAAPKRKIEIIGDSISCGYGNESTDISGGFKAKDENNYLAYGPVAARALDAQVHISSWSGLGLIRNYDDSPLPLPERLDWIIPDEPGLLWDFHSYIPQVVVINLGTNDFNNLVPNEDAFVSGYIRLIERMHGYYGDVFFICSVGSILEGERLEITRRYVRDGVVGHFQKAGNPKVVYLEYDVQNPEDGYGENNHPSLKTHAKMAERLAAEIRETTGW